MSRPRPGWETFYNDCLRKARLPTDRNLVGDNFTLTCDHLGRHIILTGTITGIEVNGNNDRNMAVRLYVSVRFVEGFGIECLQFDTHARRSDDPDPARWLVCLTAEAKAALRKDGDPAGAFDIGILHIT